MSKNPVGGMAGMLNSVEPDDHRSKIHSQIHAV